MRGGKYTIVSVSKLGLHQLMMLQMYLFFKYCLSDGCRPWKNDIIYHTTPASFLDKPFLALSVKFYLLDIISSYSFFI